MIPSTGVMRRVVPRILVSLGVSVILLALLIRFTLSSAEPAIWSGLVGVLAEFSLVFILIYLLTTLVKTVLQAIRYRLLLATSEKKIPSLYHILLVTLSRNMFVDMLPARLGELSYIAMLNRGYKVSSHSCVSSLAVSFVFDLIALGLLITFLILIQVGGGGVEKWMFGVLAMLVALILVLFILLFPGLGAVNKLLIRFPWVQRGVLHTITELLKKIQQALQDTREAGITTTVLALSVGIRIAKYLGLYCLFVGVVATQFPEMTTNIATVLAALISAEAGASLPVPAFMGFGTYEAGGTLALVALGAGKATSLIVMLAMHVVSQIVDYLLGAIGVIFYIFSSRTERKRGTEGGAKYLWRIWIPILTLLAAAGLFLVVEMRAVQKRGAIKPPDRGTAIMAAPVSSGSSLEQMHGFIVWSSNRSGNHDIYLYSLPEGQIERLTTHPHSEYYPRISPDGKQIVFARSHEPWVSQRNIYAWDVWLLDIASGKEQLLAKNGNAPTWSENGRRVYFQRNGNEVVELDIKKNREKILFKSGETVDVPSKTILETPDVSRKGNKLAVTLRGTMRATARIEKNGIVSKTGNGCQLNWGPGDRYLYKVDHGGKMKNAVHRIDPKTLSSEKWFDSPGEYSHEYFPRVANTADVLVYGASKGGHEHDSADYEIFVWKIGTPAEQAVRITHHTGNDCWPDIFLFKPVR